MWTSVDAWQQLDASNSRLTHTVAHAAEMDRVDTLSYWSAGITTFVVLLLLAIITENSTAHCDCYDYASLGLKSIRSCRKGTPCTRWHPTYHNVDSTHASALARLVLWSLAMHGGSSSMHFAAWHSSDAVVTNVTRTALTVTNVHIKIRIMLYARYQYTALGLIKSWHFLLFFPG